MVRRHNHGFGFAHARRAEQQKTSAWPAGFGEAQFAAFDGGTEAGQNLRLPANFPCEGGIELLELGGWMWI